MDFDRQAIEKRDFPIVRRGYDPAAVDAHLRALAAEIEELQREMSGRGDSSLASTAGTQVQSILQAAETAAADIERQARQSAANAREDADRDAAQTRKAAIEQARVHVAAVAQATSVLLERVASMDGEVSALTEALGAGAGRLAADLAAVQTNMGELYDAASGRTGTAPEPQSSRAEVDTDPAEPGAGDPQPTAIRSQAIAPPAAAAPTPAAAQVPAGPPAGTAGQAPATRGAVADGQLDSARLVALNMALNGESRADAERYLAEHFELIDRQKLVDEVYAAIEG